MDRNEQKAYLEMLLYIATLDGTADDEELALFREIAIANDMSEQEIDEMKIDVLGGIVAVEDIAKNIKDDDTKASLLGELITLCYIDGEYSKAEKEGMIEICNLLEIDGSVLKKIEHSFAIDEGKKKIMSGIGAVGTGIAKLGEKGLAGSKMAGKSIAKGMGFVSTKVSDAFASAKKIKQENIQLREILKKNAISETVKQKVILQLNEKITSLTVQLNAERERNKRNEEMIALLQAQLEDLTLTLETAEDAKTA